MYTVYDTVAQAPVAKHKSWPTFDGSPPPDLAPNLVLLLEEEEADPAYDATTQYVTYSGWTYDIDNKKAIRTKTVADLPIQNIKDNNIRDQWAAAPDWVKGGYYVFLNTLRELVQNNKKVLALALIEGLDPNEYTKADSGRLTTFNNMKTYLTNKVSELPD